MSKIHTISYDSRVRIFWVLISIAAGSLFVYIYAVLATVHHTVSRANLSSRSQALTAEVSELEYEDIALKNTVNLEIALSRGFAEVNGPLYVSRQKASLSLNTR